MKSFRHIIKFPSLEGWVFRNKCVGGWLVEDPFGACRKKSMITQLILQNFSPLLLGEG